MKIRTRFAPSPTGYLHLGSLRTALFNWLWAKKMAGEFIFRLEDTDQSRLVAGADKELMNDLEVLGLSWDFGPDKPSPEFGTPIQSQRLHLYKEAADGLLAKGLAYHDYTTPEQLEALRQQAREEKKPFVFRRELAQTKPVFDDQKPTVRIAIPEEAVFSWQDVVKGEQTWQAKSVADFVALKSDGWPTYHLANIVDDHFMEITHVIRADEWLSSTPKHLYLFEALNWTPPVYVHVPPVLMAAGGQKLSKRDESARVASLLKEGYMPEALINHLCLLGWNPKDSREIFSLKELIEAFDIQNIQVSGARFDKGRLDWFNGQHLRAMSPSERQAEAEKWWPQNALKSDAKYRAKVLETVYQRLQKWSELAELSEFFFQKPLAADLTVLIKETKLPEEQIQDLIQATLKAIQAIEFTPGNLELALYRLAQTQSVSPSKYFTLLRLKLTGRKVAPGLFATMDVLGSKECQKRLENN